MKNHDLKIFKNRLRGISDQDADKIIMNLSKLTGDGISPQDIFPIGIVKPDTASVKFVLTPEKHKKLIEKLTLDLSNPVFKDLKIFPLGIIVNEFYETQITLTSSGGLG